jgi:tetratricopeptide (TPR) repeat protein
MRFSYRLLLANVPLLLCIWVPHTLAGQSGAVDHYSALWLSGRAAITIDGHLSDWSALGIAASSLSVLPSPIATTADSPVLAASAQCFTDYSYLYVGINVKDRHLSFGRHGFNQAWMDDAVWIAFYGGTSLRHLVNQGYRGNDGQILLSADTFGRVTIDGAVPASRKNASAPTLQYPYLWSLLGVKAALATVEDGYTVEVAIPFELLGWSAGSRPPDLKMNIRVSDSDGGTSYARSAIWARDPYDTAIDSHEFYQTLSFERTPNHAAVPITPQSAEEHTRAIVLTAINKIADGDPDAALAQIEAIAADSRTLPLLAGAQQAADHLDASIITLQSIIRSESSLPVIAWAREQLALAYRRQRNTHAAIDQYNALRALPLLDAQELATLQLADYAAAEDGASAAIQRYGADMADAHSPRLLFKLADFLVRDAQTDEATRVYRRIVAISGITTKQQTRALFALQQLQVSAGDDSAAVDTGWLVQKVGADRDCNRTASINLLKRSVLSQPVHPNGQFTALAAALAQVIHAKDPLSVRRQMLELADFYGRAGNEVDAVRVLRHAAERPTAPRCDLASTLLRLQAALLSRGEYPESFDVGVNLQSAFPDEMDLRRRSLDLLKDTYPLLSLRTTSLENQTTYESVAKAYSRDLHNWLLTNESFAQASTLLEMFTIVHAAVSSDTRPAKE